ncbi:chromosome segregation protein [Carpediemonas membranifera]|uniref:Chromosome segregation protein n=1 Tax=Carpediemonas membranifera TaxID=201153 RepID=A0A8J6BVT4_9EUKA|nr:chromosome segregation protein [Carpediemonas membranifera]|eukprot:KAG9391731.1 chromosome segregation protein [Carpediemonas membranifera]
MPLKPLPADIGDKDSTVCSFCGVSYLIMHEVEELKNRISELEADLNKRTAEHDILASDYQQYKTISSEKVSGLEGQLKEAHTSLSHERKTVAEVRSSYSLLGRMNESLQERVNDMTASIESLTKDMGRLEILVTNYQRQYRAARNVAAKIAKALVAMKAEHKLLREDVSGTLALMQADAAEALDKVHRKYADAIDADRHRFEAYNMGLQAENNQKADEIRHLQSELAAASTRAKELQADLTSERTTARGLRSRLEADADTAKDAIRDMEAHLARGVDERAELEGKIAALEDQRRQIDRTVFRLETSEAQLKKDVAEYVATNAELTAMLEAGREKLRAEQAARAKEGKALVEANKRLTVMRTELNALNSETSDDLKNLKKDLMEKDLKIEEMIDSHKKQVEQIQNSWRARLAESKAEHEDRQRSSDSEIVKMGKEMTGLKSELKSLRGELQQAKDDAIRHERRAGDLENKLRSSASASDSGRQELKDALDATAAANREVRQLKTALSSTKEETASLTAQISRLESDLTAARSAAAKPSSGVGDERVQELEEEIEFLQLTVKNECAERAALLCVVTDLRNKLSAATTTPATATGVNMDYPTSSAALTEHGDDAADMYVRRTKKRAGTRTLRSRGGGR